MLCPAHLDAERARPVCSFVSAPESGSRVVLRVPPNRHRDLPRSPAMAPRSYFSQPWLTPAKSTLAPLMCGESSIAIHFLLCKSEATIVARMMLRCARQVWTGANNGGNRDLGVRVQAARALWQIDKQTELAILVLVEALRSDDEILRWIAADCLGE